MAKIKTTQNYFPEVDGLRTLAVVAVIINHYFEKYLPSGFLGVDMFFVISGFVITKRLVEGNFETLGQYLLDFYVRRVKRLYPALLFCLIVTSCLFLWLTTRPSTVVFKTASFAAIGFSNVFLYLKSSDYFSLDARLNPFTHTWSLGVEEQFYLLFPLLLAWMGLVSVKTLHQSRRLYVLAVATGISLVLYIGLSMVAKNAAFYLLPARFWELGVGCLCYLHFQHQVLPYQNKILMAALPFVLVLFFVPLEYQVFSTIASVFFTAIVLWTLREKNWVTKVLALRGMVFVGLLSYSLYLWHWSFLVLSKWTVGETSLVKFFCLVLTVTMALISYYLIERPIRYSNFFKSKKITLVFWVAASVAIALPLAKVMRHLSVDQNTLVSRYFGIQPPQAWEVTKCSGLGALKEVANPMDYCLSAVRTSAQPHALYLIGDSHGQQLFWAVQRALLQSSYGFYSLNTDDLGDFPRFQIVSRENKFSASFEHILHNSKEGDVVVLAFHRGHLNAQRDQHIPLSEEGSLNEETHRFLRNTQIFIAELEAKKVKVILVKDAPLLAVVSAAPACALQIKWWGESICRVSKAQDTHTRFRQDYVFHDFQRRFSNVTVWDPQPFLFGSEDWFDVLDAEGNYRMVDWHHISQSQSEQLADSFREFFRAVSN